MELPDLGKVCAEPSCKRLDFLPVQCPLCQLVFCSDHLFPHQDIVHKSSFVSELKKIEDVFICSQEGCKERSVVPLNCSQCGKHFCVQHRHVNECEAKTLEEIEREKERYHAPQRQFAQAKSVVEQNLAESRKKAKNKHLVTKVQLMRLKSKAGGSKSIPTDDRVYFSVSVRSERVVPVFVSKNWTVGRVIDAVASECKLTNHNNKSTEKKLRLFKQDRTVLSKNLSDTLASILAQEVIMNGDDLIIDYVDEECEVLPLN